MKSTGIYGYSKDVAARIALQSMRENENEFEKIIAC